MVFRWPEVGFRGRLPGESVSALDRRPSCARGGGGRLVLSLRRAELTSPEALVPYVPVGTSCLNDAAPQDTRRLGP